jgi:hypothetical protein
LECGSVVGVWECGGSVGVWECGGGHHFLLKIICPKVYVASAVSRMLRVEGVQRESAAALPIGEAESPGRLLDPKDHPYTKSRRPQDVSTIAPNATHRPSLARIGGRRVAGLFCTEHKSPSILEYLGSITVPKQTMTSIRGEARASGCLRCGVHPGQAPDRDLLQ